MDWQQNFVYVPLWLVILLVALSTGCVQYALVAAVRWSDQAFKRREEEERRRHEVARASSGVLTLDQVREERARLATK